VAKNSKRCPQKKLPFRVETKKAGEILLLFI
jgi:hypothetical protein